MSRISNNITQPLDKSEIQIQTEMFQWAWNTYPQTRRLLFHVPNGGNRSAREGMQFKASGVIAGVPDLLFIWNGQTYGFEVKTLTGTVSKVQSDLHSIWEANGISVKVVRSLEEFQPAFLAILNPGKEFAA
ncbi:VRR-NUC domain-containing protein [Sphingobacterium sp. Lzh-3]|uniref:VRR-NUC domain-containing protein n=1 Tax=Sphingobacterium sp. Lzh-3 TaxID=3382150 RepID=UPI00398C85B3